MLDIATHLHQDSEALEHLIIESAGSPLEQFEISMMMFRFTCTFYMLNTRKSNEVFLETI